MSVYGNLIKADRRHDLWGDYMIIVLKAYYRFFRTDQWNSHMEETVKEACAVLFREIISTGRKDLSAFREMAAKMYGSILS